MTSSGEVAWVTGNGTGIGRAVALKLAERGCDVAVHYNRSEAEAREVAERVRALGGDALLLPGHVADADDVEKMAQKIDERFGGLGVLVNNAGSIVERATLEESTEELWDRTVGVNLKSVYLCSRAAPPLMRCRGGGRIVNISSIAAKAGAARSLTRRPRARGIPDPSDGQGTRSGGHLGQRGLARAHSDALPRQVQFPRKQEGEDEVDTPGEGRVG